MLRDRLPEEALEALGNAERRRIVGLLAQTPRSVSALADDFVISRPAISRHLKVLESAGLVRHEPRGRHNIYRLDGVGFAAAATWLNGFWDAAEARLRLVAENTGNEK